MLNKLDASRHRHLRTITGHCWPKSLISNQALYKLCNEEPFSSKVAKQRCSMLDHVQRWTLTRPLRGHWTSLTSLKTGTRKELNKLTGTNTCRPQAGRTRTPPHSETTPVPTATCPQEATLGEHQRDRLIAAVGCHSNYRDCRTQSIIIYMCLDG